MTSLNLVSLLTKMMECGIFIAVAPVPKKPNCHLQDSWSEFLEGRMN